MRSQAIATGKRLRLLHGRALRTFRSARGWFPLTPAGVAVVAGGGGLYVFDAMRHQDLLLGMALPLFSALLAAFMLIVLGAAAAARIQTRHIRGSARLLLEAEQRASTGYRFPFPRWLLLVEVSARWDFPGAVELKRDAGHMVEYFTPARRGVIHELRRTLVFSDPTGLVEVSWSRMEAVSGWVYPARGASVDLRESPARSAGEEIPNSGGEPAGDLTEMRRYAPGDSPRLILWNVFACSRSLMVRVREKAVEDCRRICVWYLPGAGDEEAAQTLRALLEDDRLGAGWAAAVEGVPGLAVRVREALDLLALSGADEVSAVRPAEAFAEFAGRMRLRGFRECLLAGPPSRRRDMELLDATKWIPTRQLVVGKRAVPVRGWRHLVFKPDLPGRVLAASADRLERGREA